LGQRPVTAAPAGPPRAARRAPCVGTSRGAGPELSFQLGRVFSIRRRDKEARAAFARTVAIAPGHADALFALARACQAERDFVEAEKIYRRMVTAMPKDAAAKIGLGICLTELGRGEEALEHLRAASRTNDKMFGEAVGARVYGICV